MPLQWSIGYLNATPHSTFTLANSPGFHSTADNSSWRLCVRPVERACLSSWAMKAFRQAPGSGCDSGCLANTLPHAPIPIPIPIPRQTHPCCCSWSLSKHSFIRQRTTYVARRGSPRFNIGILWHPPQVRQYSIKRGQNYGVSNAWYLAMGKDDESQLSQTIFFTCL